MSVPNPHIRFTYDEYKTLPESMEKRYELLDGDILMVPAPTTAHQRISPRSSHRIEHRSGAKVVRGEHSTHSN